MSNTSLCLSSQSTPSPPLVHRVVSFEGFSLPLMRDFSFDLKRSISSLHSDDPTTTLLNSTSSEAFPAPLEPFKSVDVHKISCLNSPSPYPVTGNGASFWTKWPSYDVCLDTRLWSVGPCARRDDPCLRRNTVKSREQRESTLQIPLFGSGWTKESTT